MKLNFEILDSPRDRKPMTRAEMDARADECRLELIALLKAELDKAVALKEAMPWDLIERSREEAPMRAMVQVTDEAVLFRRYETAAARELGKIFDYFGEVEKAAAEAVVENVDASPAIVEGSGAVASFGDEPGAVEPDGLETEVGSSPVGIEGEREA